MGSPFSGMDPYIVVSHLWGDFHTSLISEIKRALEERLPESYVVRACAGHSAPHRSRICGLSL
jgi:hypothetical protein